MYRSQAPDPCGKSLRNRELTHAGGRLRCLRDNSTYKYMIVSIYLYLSLSLYIYIYYTCLPTHTYVCTYMYT